MKFLLTIAASLSLFSLSCHAEEIQINTGNDYYYLWQKMKNNNSPDQSTAQNLLYGYTKGALDAHLLNKTICPPKSVTYSQLIDVVGTSLEKMPQLRDKPIGMFIKVAFQENYSCN